MKSPIITIVIALACYTLANFLNNTNAAWNIAPMTAAIFAAIGAFGALSISTGIK
jgi:hypothetical protein